MKYQMSLILEGRELSIPVLPPVLKIRSGGKNEKTTVISLGEILILRQKALRSVQWDSLFPLHGAGYVTGALVAPIEAVRAIQATRDDKKPLRLLMTGTNLDINVLMGVDDFNYEERAGEPGDIYYSLSLTEWRDYSPRRIILPETSEQPAVVEEPARSGEPEAASQTTYTVVSGDSLWAIAQTHYGKGDRYSEIYVANRALIDARNRQTGASKYTIYPGQALTIP